MGAILRPRHAGAAHIAPRPRSPGDSRGSPAATPTGSGPALAMKIAPARIMARHSRSGRAAVSASVSADGSGAAASRGQPDLAPGPPAVLAYPGDGERRRPLARGGFAHAVIVAWIVISGSRTAAGALVPVGTPRIS